MGLSKMEGMADPLNTTKGVMRGTSLYMAYEMITESVGSSFSADVWEIGCVIVEIYSEDYIWPNLGYFIREGLEKIFLEDPLPLPSVENVPEIVRPVIAACFIKDPTKRPKCNTIFDLFKLL